MFHVKTDRSRLLIVLTAVGFFTPDVIEEAGAELHAAIHSLGENAGRHLTLYDLRALQVAPGEAVAYFRQYFTDVRFQSIWARRVALVTRSALATLQMRRVQQGLDHVRLFNDRDAALQWLLRDDAATAPSVRDAAA